MTRSNATESPFLAGYAERDITPGIGAEIPGLFERRTAEGVADPLYVRAKALDDGRNPCAFVQVDAICVPDSVITQVRKEISRFCGIPAKSCMIAATHTHSGGPVADVFRSSVDDAYLALLCSRIVSALAEAYAARRPVLMTSACASAPGVAFNRRFVMRDGSHRTHPGKMNANIVAPAGPEDSTVTVTAFADPATWQITGCIVNFACHATHMNGTRFSADYPRWVVETIRAMHGPACGVVFLNGACGDVTQVANQDARPSEFGPWWCARTGRAIGTAALQAIATAEWRDRASLDCATAYVQAAIRPITDAQVAHARRLLASSETDRNGIEAAFARELIEVARMRAERATRSLEIMAIRLGRALYWGAPCELFQDYAMSVRTASPFTHTCCAELANGYQGYVATAEAFEGGGYEVRTARSSLLAADTGDQIVRAANMLARRLQKKLEMQSDAERERTIWPSEASDAPIAGLASLKRGNPE
jgi:hypothetical protein